MATGAPGEAPFEAIVLAAGRGARFGGGKLLAPWGEGVLLDGALGAALAAPVRSVILATGAEAGRVEAAARAFAGRDARLRIVRAERWREGMGASLAAGAAALPEDAAGVFVFLGDMPRVPQATPEALASAVRQGAPAAAPVFEGRRGHPALIGRALIPELRALSGDQGARAILQGLGERLALVEAPDDGVVFDVDEPGDLRPRS